MGGEIQHRTIGVEYGIGPITMVNIPIHYQNLLEIPGLGMSCRYGHIIEDAKAHAAIGHGMVAGRPDQGKSSPMAFNHRIHGSNGATRCHEGGIKRVFGEDGIDIEVAASPLAYGLHLIYIIPPVYCLDLLDRRGFRRDALNIQSFGFDSIQDCRQAFLSLRMSIGIVQ